MAGPMSTLKKRAREIAHSHSRELYETYDDQEKALTSLILAFAKEVLEREPSDEAFYAGLDESENYPGVLQIYKAMSAVRAKELEE